MVSIVIPVYNAAAVLSTCLESLLAQTYTDFEVLLIDDGSDDGSASLCDQYAVKDSRIHAFHKYNEGVSSARNLGLDKASGEIIAFVDSDDAVESNYLEKLIEYFAEDFVICGFKNTEGIAYTPEAMVVTKEQMNKEVPIMVQDPFLLYTPWSKLFRRSLIEEHQLRFDTRLCLYEDAIFVLAYLALCNSVRKLCCSGYLYSGVWGGTRKYILSLEDVEYRCQAEISALQRLEHTFSCNIDKMSRAYCVEYLDDLYGRYSDLFCIDMYLRYHHGVVRKEFLCNLYLYPSYALISRLKRLYQQRLRLEGQMLMKKLCVFFTLPTAELYFNQKNEKLLYTLIRFKYLKLADFILCIYSIFKR